MTAETPRATRGRPALPSWVIAVGGLVVLVLVAAAWMWMRSSNVGMSCQGSSIDDCVYTPSLPAYVVTQVLQYALTPLGTAAALAVVTGAIGIVITLSLLASTDPADRGGATAAAAGAAAAGADATGTETPGAVVPPLPSFVRSPRRALRIIWIAVLVLLGLSALAVVMVALPSMQQVWSSGDCDYNGGGCAYPLTSQLVIIAVSVAPSVLTAALLAIPLLVLAGTVLRVVAQALGDRTGGESEVGRADVTVADAVTTPAAGAADADAGWWDELDREQATRGRRARRETSWDGRDLSPFMRPDAE